MSRAYEENGWVSPDAPHGTLNGYSNYDCRCVPCRRANLEYHLPMRDVRHGRMLRGEVDPPHGDENTYFNYKCRCRPCKDAHNTANTRRRRLRVSS